MSVACQPSVPDSIEKVVDESLKSDSHKLKKGAPRNSNLATPTPLLFEKGSKKPIFSSLKRSVADKSGSYVPRKALINLHGYPYHEARLIDFDNHPSKKWYIVFYAWDIGKEKLVRKRIGKFELNKIKNLNERKDEATVQIRGLNDALSKGAYLQTAKEKDEIKSYDLHGYKLIAALDYVYN